MRACVTASAFEPFGNNPGSVLLSHTASRAVPLAPKSLTSEFGMGSGVASSKSPPEILGRWLPGSVLVEKSGHPLYLRSLRNKTRKPNPGRELFTFLRNVIKPHDLLVPVSSVDCSTSTPGLSTL